MNSSLEKPIIGGIQVQMYMWAKTFAIKGWSVYTYTGCRKNHKKIIDEISYIYYPTIPVIGPFISLAYSLLNIVFLQPSVIIVNGATRDLYFITKFSKLVSSKVVEVFASDSDLVPGSELINRNFDRRLFRMGIYNTHYFVVQNIKQKQLLQSNYKKKHLVLAPSMWIKNSKIAIKREKKDIILWVANFRSLKRPEWFILLAKSLPDKKFLMVGNPLDNYLFEQCKRMIVGLYNIDLVPGLSFLETAKLFEHAHLFICTSEIEGFPNTFLQAWMNGCPVLSSYDPSNLIVSRKLGLFCTSIDEFHSGIVKFEDPDYYRHTSDGVISYFKENHSAEANIVKIIERFTL